MDYGNHEDWVADDTDLKILESDYSNSTVHLASRSSMMGYKDKTGYGSRLSMNNSGLQTYTTGFFESH